MAYCVNRGVQGSSLPDDVLESRVFVSMHSLLLCGVNVNASIDTRRIPGVQQERRVLEPEDHRESALQIAVKTGRVNIVK